jgi:hypothetical protein
MWSLFCKFVLVVLIPILVPRLVIAEQPERFQVPVLVSPGSPHPVHPPPPVTQSSGYIFAGTVKSVERPAANENGVATVQVTFHVDQGLRGVRSGQVLAIREWAGLWESGERYRPGERVLLFLYPPSKLGLTSPVQGPMGRFHIGPDGQIVLDPGRIGLPSRRPSVQDPLRGRIRLTPAEFVRYLRSMEEE